MSQHGETPESSATRPSFDTGNTQETFGLQAEVISNCIEIVQQFRTGKITKPKAALLLQQAIPKNETDEDAYVSAYGSYLDMLNNFEWYRTGNSRRVDETQGLLGVGQSGEHRDQS